MLCTFGIWERQPLHELLLDLAYSTCRSERVVFLFLLPEEEGPSTTSVPPSFSRILCWSSQRSDPNPEISATARGLLCLKKQLKWYQFGCLPSKNGDCRVEVITGVTSLSRSLCPA